MGLPMACTTGWRAVFWRAGLSFLGTQSQAAFLYCRSSLRVRPVSPGWWQPSRWSETGWQNSLASLCLLTLNQETDLKWQFYWHNYFIFKNIWGIQGLRAERFTIPLGPGVNTQTAPLWRAFDFRVWVWQRYVLRRNSLLLKKQNKRNQPKQNKVPQN